MAGRPPKEKSFANMLRIAINDAHEEGGTNLRALADALVKKGLSGDVAAIREIGDRIDGKVPQGIVGDEDADPINIVQRIERHIIRANTPDTDS